MATYTMPWINAQKMKPFLDAEMAKEIILVTEVSLENYEKTQKYSLQKLKDIIKSPIDCL